MLGGVASLMLLIVGVALAWDGGGEWPPSGEMHPELFGDEVSCCPTFLLGGLAKVKCVCVWRGRDRDRYTRTQSSAQ